MAGKIFGNKMNSLVNPKNSRETTIRSFPDDVVCNILSHLSTKNSIRASTVVRKWENLWLHASRLDLNTDDFKDDSCFWEFFGRFIEFNQGLNLKIFKLFYNVDEHEHDYFVGCIDKVLRRRVSHLSIVNAVEYDDDTVRMPLSLYSSRHLVKLYLSGVAFDDVASESISLPSLKTMHLEEVKFDGYNLMKTFISRCLVLEELVIATYLDDALGLVGIQSCSLKSFTLVSNREDHMFEEFEDDRPSDPDVEIDAPRLEHMVITDYQCEKFVVNKIGPCAKVNVDIIFVNYDDDVERNLIRNLFTGISKVEKLTISAPTLKMICDCNGLGPLPQFPNLLSLDLSFIETTWEMLPVLLGCCPNIRSLVLECDPWPETEEVNFSYVPPCFVSSLEYVELTTLLPVQGTESKKLARYFLRNCTVLKTLLLSKTFENIVNEIKEIQRKSAECEITC